MTQEQPWHILICQLNQILVTNQQMQICSIDFVEQMRGLVMMTSVPLVRTEQEQI